MGMTRTLFLVHAKLLRTPALFLCLSTLYFLLSTFYSASSANAALLYFDPSSLDVHRGDTATVALRLDTDEGECVNTVSGVIRYDASVRAVDVSRGSSILNIWLEEPTINETEHTVAFTAGITNGYCGRIPGDPSLTNVVLELVLRSPGFNIGGGSNPTARVWLDDSTQVLLNDGLGTPATLSLQDAEVNLLATAGSAPQDEWRAEVQADKEAPADFAITLTRDEVAFNGKYFIVFSTTDKQSGIDHYEVMEEPLSELGTFRWGRADAPWVPVESPHILADQTLNSTIRVKAFDKAGNTRIATLVPEAGIRSISRDRLITFAVVGVFTVSILGFLFYGLWKRRERILAEEDRSNAV